MMQNRQPYVVISGALIMRVTKSHVRAPPNEHVLSISLFVQLGEFCESDSEHTYEQKKLNLGQELDNVLINEHVTINRNTQFCFYVVLIVSHQQKRKHAQTFRLFLVQCAISKLSHSPLLFHFGFWS